MKKKAVFMLLAAMIFAFIAAGSGFAAHEEKGTAKGTITEIKIIEVELTVKDAKGKEMKVKTKDPALFKLGDSVVIKDGKVSKEVKPITGGY